MNNAKNRKAGKGSANAPFVHAKSFIFCDRNTGLPCFHVNARLDGGMPVEQAVSLLALHCVMRHQKPRDFKVMIAPGEDLVAGLAAPATLLIQTCGAPVCSGILSRRQQEVLSGVEGGLTNKEIASRLSLSERTVKFHVSALLGKFRARGRTELLLMAVDPSSPRNNPARWGAPGLVPEADHVSERQLMNPGGALPVMLREKRTLR